MFLRMTVEERYIERLRALVKTGSYLFARLVLSSERLSYRMLEEMIDDPGLHLDQAMINRWLGEPPCLPVVPLIDCSTGASIVQSEWDREKRHKKRNGGKFLLLRGKQGEYYPTAPLKVTQVCSAG